MSGKKRQKPKSALHLAARRPAGLDGTYSGTCIACLKGTDTALGVQGVPEWHAAFLVRLGLPMKEAITTTARFLGEMAAEYGLGPDGEPQSVYRVCESCATRAGFGRPVLAVPGQPIPMIGQRPA